MRAAQSLSGVHRQGMRDPHRHPAVMAIMASNHGIVTREQALGAGLAPADIDRAIRSGEWVLVRRGHYVASELWEELDVYVGRPALEARVAWMGMRNEYAISHDSAAAFLGISTLKQEQPLVHLTRLGAPRARVKHGIKHHQARVLLPHLQRIDDVVVLDRARTAVDIAREHGLQPGVVAVDSARLRGVSLDELWAAAEPMWRWPNITTARAAIELSDARAESAGESLARLLVEELGLGPVQTQFEIRDGVRWARCDMRVGRHLFEFDGFVKYHRRDLGDGRNLEPERVVWEEKQRQDWLLGYHLGISRLVWADFWGSRREEAKERIAREYALTCARFGTSIDDLSHLVVRSAA